MRYHVIVFDRDSVDVWSATERQDLIARNLKDAKKEAEHVKDKYGHQNVTVVLYNEEQKRIAKFVAYKPTYL